MMLDMLPFSPPMKDRILKLLAKFVKESQPGTSLFLHCKSSEFVWVSAHN